MDYDCVCNYMRGEWVGSLNLQLMEFSTGFYEFDCITETWSKLSMMVSQLLDVTVSPW